MDRQSVPITYTVRLDKKNKETVDEEFGWVDEEFCMIPLATYQEN